MTDTAATGRRSAHASSAPTDRPMVRGALAGAIATVVFMGVHDRLIMPIWGMTAPMVVAGALCGLCIAWSHARIRSSRGDASWFALNGAYLTSLIILGVVSLIGHDPTWTFVELNTTEPPLGELFGAALPLMVTFTLAAALALWFVFGRTLASLLPFLITEACLVFLLGHNVAIVGLVDLTAHRRPRE